MSTRARRTLLIVMGVVAGLATACGRGGEPIARLDWRESDPPSGEVRGDAVAIEATQAGGLFPLAVIDGPAVDGEGYAVRGEVRYEGVQGQGFLEMWSVFPDGGRYFSRTLGTEGPSAALVGTSDWRDFELPFYLDGGSPPDRLELDLVLPGAGTVEIGPLELVPIGSGAGAWWSERTGGLVGGIVGSVIGVLGALVGLLVARRRARAVALGAMTAAVAIGAALLLVGAVAVAASQPYAVAYPILLTGAILVAVFGGLLPRAKRAYADHELRRMRALDGA